MSDSAEVIDFNTFNKVEMRVGRVLEVRDHPNADKLLCMTVDLGSEQRQLVAGLKGYYEPDQLVGKDVVVVVNLEPRKMRGELSQGMVLAAVTEDFSQVRLVMPDSEIPPGSRVT